MLQRYVPESISSTAREHSRFSAKGTAVGSRVSLTVLARSTREVDEVLSTSRRVCESALAWLGGVPGTMVIDVVMLCHPAKRVLPDDDQTPLGPEHLNGGVTISFPDGRVQVFVFRKEDCFKVLIHELIHAVRWFPEAQMRDAGLERRIGEVFGFRPSKGSLHLDEAVVDALACWLWARMFGVPWDKVLSHSRRLSGVVAERLRLSGLESTHAFAYCVAKAELMKEPGLSAVLSRDVAGIMAVIHGMRPGPLPPAGRRPHRSLRMTPMP
jgi:hypothetical protein